MSRAKKPVVILQKIAKCDGCGQIIEVTYFEGDKGYSITCSKCGKHHEVLNFGNLVGHHVLE